MSKTKTNKEINFHLNRLIKDGLIDASALSSTWLYARGLEVGENGLVRKIMPTVFALKDEFEEVKA